MEAEAEPGIMTRRGSYKVFESSNLIETTCKRHYIYIYIYIYIRTRSQC